MNKIKSTEDAVIAKLKPVEAPMGLTRDQKAIWDLFERQKLLAIRKNHDYGSSVFLPPVMAPGVESGTAILVRMSDKIHRIQQLLDLGNHQVADETLSDTFCDLGTYAFLYVIWRSRDLNKNVLLRPDEVRRV